MARRKIRYPDKPHIMDPVIRAKFEALIKKGKEKPVLEIKHTWQLWRWDTLEDVPQHE